MNRREFLSLTGAAAASLQTSRKPNIVLFYADDVGYGDVSCYGATRVHTPNIDSIAGRGLRTRP